MNFSNPLFTLSHYLMTQHSSCIFLHGWQNPDGKDFEQRGKRLSVPPPPPHAVLFLICYMQLPGNCLAFTAEEYCLHWGVEAIWNLCTVVFILYGCLIQISHHLMLQLSGDDHTYVNNTQEGQQLYKLAVGALPSHRPSQLWSPIS